MAKYQDSETRNQRGKPFEKGNPGRKPGSKNKATERKVVLEKLQAAGIEPVDALAAELKLAQAQSDHKAVVEIAGLLMPYCYPKLKSTDHQVSGTLTVEGVEITFRNGTAQA